MGTRNEPKYQAGDVVILKGLRESARDPHSGLLPPRVGRIAKVGPGGRLFVQLHLGTAFRRTRAFCARGRVCSVANVLRLATPREATLGSRVLLETLAVAA